MIEQTLATQIGRTQKAEKEKQTMEQDLRIAQDRLNQYQLLLQLQGGVDPNMMFTHKDVDWHTVKEKNTYAMDLLNTVTREAKFSLDTLLRHTRSLQEVTWILKDLDKIAVVNQEE